MERKHNDYLLKYVANRVKNYRKEAGLSQEELSEKAGLGLKYINQLENQNNNLTIQSLEKVIRALELTPEEFFSFSHEKKLDSDEASLAIRRLNMKINQLPKDKLENFVHIFETILDNL